MFLSSLSRVLLAAAAASAWTTLAAQDYVAVINQSDKPYVLGYARSASGSVAAKGSDGRKVELRGYDDKVTVPGSGLVYVYPSAGDRGWMSVYFRLTDSDGKDGVVKIESKKAGDPWVLTNADNVPSLQLDQTNRRVVITSPRIK